MASDADFMDFVADPVEEPPFQGAKPWLLIEDELGDREGLRASVRATAAARPKPGKPRPPKAGKAGRTG